MPRINSLRVKLEKMVINTVRIHISCTLCALPTDLLYLTKIKDQLSGATKKIEPSVSQNKWEETLMVQDQTTTMMGTSNHLDWIRNKDHLVLQGIKD